MITRTELEAMALNYALSIDSNIDNPALIAGMVSGYINGALAAMPIVFEAVHEKLPRGEISFNGHRGWRLKYPTAADLLRVLEGEK